MRSGHSERLRLHLGCGAVAPPEWTNIDYSWNAVLAKLGPLRRLLCAVGLLPSHVAAVSWSPDVMIHDLTKRLPFGDETTDCVYSSHSLEHLTRVDARHLLADCYRVLKPGGAIRVVVPDLFCMAKEYFHQSELDPSSAAERFLRDLTVFAESQEPNPLIRSYRAFHDAGHKWMYDEALLRHCLRDTGFTDVTRRDFRDSVIPDIEQVEVVGHRFEKSFCLEAVKPHGSGRSPER